MSDKQEIERLIIGSIVLDSDKTMPLCMRAGMSADWYDDASAARAYEVCLDLFSRGRPADPITVAKRAGLTPRVIDEWVDAVPHRYAAPNYISELDDIVTKSRALRLFTNSIQSLERTTDVSDKLAEIQQSLTEITIRRLREEVSVDATLESLKLKWSGEADRDGLPWPLRRLNHYNGRIRDELIYVVASESVGKTAFAIQTMLRIEQAGHKVAFASLESKKRRILPRFISQLALVNTLWVGIHGGTEDELKRIHGAIQNLKEMNLMITDTPMTLDQLFAWGKLSKSKGAELLVIDNTRHIRMKGSRRSAVEEMRELSIRLKGLRDDLDMPVMVLHHANALGDVSWSSDIRRDADILLFLVEQRDEANCPIYVDEPTTENKWSCTVLVDIEIRKNRDGLRDIRIPVQFVRHHQYFEEQEEQNTSW